MTFYIEPINLRQWNLFDKVKGPGHVEPFLATRDMQIGDIVMLHVGKQDPAHESGIYAYGTVIYRIDRIEYEKPILTHEQCMRYTGQYRTVHSIADSFNGNLKMVLGID